MEGRVGGDTCNKLLFPFVCLSMTFVSDKGNPKLFAIITLWNVYWFFLIEYHFVYSQT